LRESVGHCVIAELKPFPQRPVLPKTESSESHTNPRILAAGNTSTTSNIPDFFSSDRRLDLYHDHCEIVELLKAFRKIPDGAVEGLDDFSGRAPGVGADDLQNFLNAEEGIFRRHGLLDAVGEQQHEVAR